MNEYNDIWTREKFVEYRRLKRSGYSQRELIEHFGDDIYHSGLCRRGGDAWATALNQNMEAKMKEMQLINSDPKKTYYDISESPSDTYTDKTNYYLELLPRKEGIYNILFIYNEIDMYSTYDVVFTTMDGHSNYIGGLLDYLTDNKGFVTKDQQQKLKNVVIKDTDTKVLKDIYESFSYALSNFYTRNLNSGYLSIEEIEDEDKLNLYRSIIKDAFPKIEEEVTINDKKYFIYK